LNDSAQIYPMKIHCNCEYKLIRH